MEPQKQEVIQGPAGEARLRQLGLDSRVLVDAVRAAEIERRSCSRLEPSTAPGFKAWAAAFGRLAEELIPRGWVKTETQGLPRLVNKKTRVAVAVCHGDERTGNKNLEPDFKNPRGSQSVLLIRSNRRQLSLYSEDRFVPVPDEEEQITWWLLIYSDGADVLRAEFVLPVRLGADSQYSNWDERIILEIPTPDSPSVPSSEEEGPEIPITVRPKR